MYLMRNYRGGVSRPVKARGKVHTAEAAAEAAAAAASKSFFWRFIRFNIPVPGDVKGFYFLLFTLKAKDDCCILLL